MKSTGIEKKMFLLSKDSSVLKKYRIEIDGDLTSDILSIDLFYATPDSVASYEFETEELVAADDRVRPIYKFLCQLLNTNGNSRKDNIVYLSTNTTQNHFDCGSSVYNAIVNLSGVYDNQIFFHRRNQQKEYNIEPETQDDENSFVQLAPPDNYQMSEEPDDKEKFISFVLPIDHNQLVVYDPNIFYITSTMTKYQVFSVY